MTSFKPQEVMDGPAAIDAPDGHAADADGIGRATFRRFDRTAIQGSLAAALVASAGLLAYLPGLRVLGGIRPDYIPMAPSTSVCLLILCTVVFCHVRELSQGSGQTALFALALLVTVFGLDEAVHPWLGFDLEDLFIPQAGTLGTIPVGRMSPVSGAGFVTAGLAAILLLRSRNFGDAQRFGNWAACLGVGTFLLGATVLLAYLYGTPLMYGGRVVPMAATTAFAFMSIGGALVAAAGPERLPMRLVIGDSTSAALSRVFLPLVVGAVFVESVLSRFVSLSFTGHDAVLLAIVVIVVTTLTIAVVARVAKVIGDRIDEFNRRLQASEEYLSITLRSIGDGVITTDAAGRVAQLNPTAERLSGWTLADARGRPMAEVFRIVNAETRLPVADPVQLVMARGEVVGLANHTVLLARDGREYQIADSAAPIRNAAGEIIGVVLVFSDVTEKYNLTKAMRDSEEQFRTLAALAPAGIYVTDAQGDCLYANSRWCEMAGMDMQAALGQGWVQGVHPEDRDYVFANWNRLVDSGGKWGMEYRFQTPDKHVTWVYGVASPQHDDAGKKVRYVGVNLDITERKQADAELVQYRNHLEELVASRTAELEAAKGAAEAASIAKSAFLSNMSHEIRTPMNAILGMANLMRRSGVTRLQEERFDKIDTAARHLLAVIDDILDLSKIEAGKFMLEQAPVEIASLMANVSSIVSERAAAKGLRLMFETESLPRRLLGDPARLQQALLNYTGNAIKFTDTGSVTVRALLEDEADDFVRVRFEVSDTGVGIAPEALSRLFNAFEQADNSMTRKYGGTGLGLAITRHLVTLMGGEFGADSTPGAGSTFWFTALLKKSSEASTCLPAADADTDAEKRVQQRHSGARILVVDDEPINREVAQIQLETADLVVDTAEDGAEAVAMAQKSAYAAIFMDMQMPKLNGLEATRQIRQMSQHRDTPIIAMTANAFAEDKARCSAAGMTDFLVKPFDPDKLFATLLRALSRPGD